MNRKEALARIAEIAEDVLDIDASDVTEDLSRETCEDWDSLTQITLLVSVEHEFGVKFTTNEMAELGSIGAIADSLASKGTLS